MSELLNFQWPAREEGGEEEEAVPEAWNDPEAWGDPQGTDAETDDATPSDEVLVLYVDRAIARRRIEQLGRAYAGALDIIDAQRRRLLALERTAGNAAAPPTRLRSLGSKPASKAASKAAPGTSWLDRLFGTSTRRDPRPRPAKR